MERVVVLFLLLAGFTVSAQDRHPFYDRGYAGNLEAGVLIRPYSYMSLSSTHGYCFGRGWFLGVGGSFEIPFNTKGAPALSRPQSSVGHADTYLYDGERKVKLFLDLRKTFLFGDTGLFIDAKFGCPHDLPLDPIKWDEFVRPTIGVIFKRRLAVCAGMDWSRGSRWSEGSDTFAIRTTSIPYIGLALNF